MEDLRYRECWMTLYREAVLDGFPEDRAEKFADAQAIDLYKTRLTEGEHSNGR
jgi:hypothetical protein